MKGEVIHMPCCLPPWEMHMDSNQGAPADRYVYNLFPLHWVGGFWRQLGHALWPKLAKRESSLMCQQLHDPSSGGRMGWASHGSGESLIQVICSAWGPNPFNWPQYTCFASFFSHTFSGSWFPFSLVQLDSRWLIEKITYLSHSPPP